MLRLAVPLLVLAACSTRSGAVEAPMVVTVAPVGSAAPRAEPPAAALPDGECSLKLHAETPISLSSPGCYLDEHIRASDGVVTYPCSGDGRAFAVFGPQRYEGSIHGGELELHAETELDWPQDGCHWGTTAVIRGPVSGKLVWTYEDRVMAGHDCSGVCHAHTRFETLK